MANVLGTDYVTVLDMATAYATIAAEGVRANPYIVKEIRFQDESVPTIKAKVVKQQVFDKDLMSDVIDAMTYPVEGGTARYVGRNLGRPAAGKTGTSESFRSAWFNGYVPQLRDGRRPLPRRQGRRGAPDGGPPQRRQHHRWHLPGPDLDGLHGGRPRGHQGRPVPGAGRHQQGRRPAAAHDQGPADHDERPADHDERAARPRRPRRRRTTQGPPSPKPSKTKTNGPPSPDGDDLTLVPPPDG